MLCTALCWSRLRERGFELEQPPDPYRALNNLLEIGITEEQGPIHLDKIRKDAVLITPPIFSTIERK
jgi:hypothetical protein